MKFNKILIISMVLISLFAIGAASAADADGADAVEAAAVDEVQTIDDVNQDKSELLSKDVEDNLKADDKDEAISAVDEDNLKADVKDDEVLSDGVAVGDKANITQNITIKVDGKELNSFNYTYLNGSFDFKDLLEKCNLSGEADFNMSKFGNFSDMFRIFNDVNFGELNKTFDFTINGNVYGIQYSLKVRSNDVNFLFDYNIISPAANGTAPTSSAKRIEIYGDNALLANLTIVNGNTGFDFGELMKMFDMSDFNMSSFGNFKDMFGMFDNNTFASNSSDNKTYDFIIGGTVGIITYNLKVHSNATAFVFDYNISRPIADAVLTVKDLTTTTVNTALDGKTGGYLTMTLKDKFGNALANKALKLVLDGKTIDVNTNNNGVAKYQVNFAKAGTYVASVFFLGDNMAKAAMATAKVTVKKQTTKLLPLRKPTHSRQRPLKRLKLP